MPRSVLPTFLVYCFITSITPGPANLCSLSAGLRYGRQVALRQWYGLASGFLIDALAAVVLCRALGGVLGGYVGYLSWVGAAYILWMAWRLLRSAGTPPAEDARRPTYYTGLLLNLTNVKVILFCVTALSTFVLPWSRSFLRLLAVGLALTVIGPCCNLVWLFAGARLQAVFSRFQKTIDVLMAAALALCAVSLVLPR